MKPAAGPLRPRYSCIRLRRRADLEPGGRHGAEPDGKGMLDCNAFGQIARGEAGGEGGGSRTGRAARANFHPALRPRRLHRESHRRRLQFIQGDSSGGGDVQAFHGVGVRHGDGGDLVARLAREPAHTVALAAEDKRDPAFRERAADERRPCRVSRPITRPGARSFQRDQGAGDIDRAQQGHGFQGAGGRLGEGAGFIRGVAVLRDDRGGGERSGRAQDGADVAGIGHLVEYLQADRAVRSRAPGPAVAEDRQEGRALMNHVAAEQMVEGGADTRGRDRPGWRRSWESGSSASSVIISRRKRRAGLLSAAATACSP